ncbi:MAG: hypothetical protein ACHQPI_03810, partial [Thermoanaerobaculia bacterium]
DLSAGGGAVSGNIWNPSAEAEEDARTQKSAVRRGQILTKRGLLSLRFAKVQESSGAGASKSIVNADSPVDGRSRCIN